MKYMKKEKKEKRPQRSKTPPKRLKKLYLKRNVVRTREEIEAKKNRISSKPRKEKKRKNMKAKSPSNGPLLTTRSTEAQKPNFHIRKSSFFTIGTSGRVFAGFGVCSDDWKKKKMKKKGETEEKIGKNKREKKRKTRT